jgi:hypothetical protein
VTSKFTMPGSPLPLVCFHPHFLSRTCALALNEHISIAIYDSQMHIERCCIDITSRSYLPSEFTMPWSPLLLVCFPPLFLSRTCAISPKKHVLIDMYDLYTHIERY